MNSREIESKLKDLVLKERKITNEILHLIRIAMDGRCYLELGYSSMFDWLTKGFKYSNAAAFRRIEGAKLLKSVPSVAERLESGVLNLSTLSRAQHVIRVHERVAGKRLDDVEKAQVVGQIENKSLQETDQILMKRFPESASVAQREVKRVVNGGAVRHAFNLPPEAAADLVRAKEVLSHKFPSGSDAEVIAHALKFLLDNTDPLRKRSSLAPRGPSNSKAQIRRAALQDSGAACTFRDPITGKVCGSRHQVQLDHIQPKAFGGPDHAENLRSLCRQHNLLMAERAFGKQKMEQWRRET